jgi:dienelactone hydrolase
VSFRADAAGGLDLDRAVALNGSYRGVWGMGLLAMMQPTTKATSVGYFWHGARPQAFRLTIRSLGRTLTSAMFVRRFSALPARYQHESLAEHGFFGEYWTPIESGKHPAVLVIGGSEGGDLGGYLVSALLAAHGYPSLDIAYFKEPGLPQTLSGIPLEYFAKALAWLRRQPNVDPSQVVAMGVSRGSEAALLLGARYPDLVDAVVASVPSDAAICSYPSCAGPAWTLHGKAIPYTRQFDQPYPTDKPNAVIPVERIHGAIFLDCGGRDEIWTSCDYAHAIMQRLNAHHDRYRHVLYREPDAGHSVGGIPDEPGFTGYDTFTEKARERLWPRLIAFLRNA